MNTIKKAFLASCGFVVAMALCACGDDDSSFLNNRDDVGVESSSSGSKGSSSAETIVDIKEDPISETDTIDLGEFEQEDAVVDRDGDKVYNLMTSGINIWILENLDSKAPHPTSTCYDYVDSLCRDYGRLYSEVDDAAALCPDGYEVPGAADYRLLLESKDDYKPVYAGSCVHSRSEALVCTGVNDTAFYMTRDDSIVVVPKSGSWEVMRNDGRFGSVRCIKERSIVEKNEDLPKCSGGIDGRIIYVIEKDSAFDCIADEWEYTGNYTACKNGEKYLYKGRSDTLYSCSNGMWAIAGMDDIGRPCLSSNRHEDVTLNGTRYACSDSGWAALQYPASELGECYVALFQTVAKVDSNTTFACKNTGVWERATAIDIYGICTVAMHGTIVKIDSVQYFCSSHHQHLGNLLELGHWEPDYFDRISNAVGFCTDDRYKDTVIYDGEYVVCGMYNSWTWLNNLDVLPPCESTRWDTTVFVGHREYLCNHITKKWQEVKHWLFDDQTDSLGCTVEEYGNVYLLNGEKSMCKLDYKNLFAFQSPFDVELKFGVCGLDTTYVIVEDTIGYFCRNGSWTTGELNKYERMFGICPRDTTYQLPLDTAIYTCDDGRWTEYVLNEYERKLGICPRDTTYQVSEDTVVYTCKNGDWSEYVMDD